MFDPVGRYFDDGADDLGVELTFDQAMNQAVVPLVGAFTFARNGVPWVPDNPAWTDATHLKFTSADSYAATTRVDVELDAETNLLITTGALVHTVFDLDDIPDA